MGNAGKNRERPYPRPTTLRQNLWVGQSTRRRIVSPVLPSNYQIQNTKLLFLGSLRSPQPRASYAPRMATDLS